jgi:hypothetical protein
MGKVAARPERDGLVLIKRSAESVEGTNLIAFKYENYVKVHYAIDDPTSSNSQPSQLKVK